VFKCQTDGLPYNVNLLLDRLSVLGFESAEGICPIRKDGVVTTILFHPLQVLTASYCMLSDSLSVASGIVFPLTFSRMTMRHVKFSWARTASTSRCVKLKPSHLIEQSE